MHTLRCFGLLCCLLWLAGCESETLAPQHTRLGLTYFPLEVGQYALYDVQDIRYVFGQQADTSRYQLKEAVADSFPGEGGEITYRLERYKRTKQEMPWQIDSVWTARKNNSRVVVTENNIPFIKLVFPFSQQLAWNGHALNSLGEQTYRLVSTPASVQAAIRSPLDSLLAGSLTVMQYESQDTIITYVQKLETYAEDVGLFYKKSVNLQYCASDPSCIGLGIIESGWHYQQTLFSHGKEIQ